jgi:hypothetical protein
VRRDVPSPLPAYVCPHRRCAGRLRPLGDEVLEQAAPLAKLLLPSACRGGHRLALPPRARSRVDRVRWHSPSCRVTRLGSDAPSTSPPPTAKGQRHARVASTRGRRSSSSLRRLRPRARATDMARSSTSCQGRAIPSIPSTLRPRSYKRDLPRAFCPRHWLRHPSPDLTSLPLSSSTGPGAPTHLGAAFRGVVDFPRPPKPSGAVDHVGEFHPSIVRLPYCELGLSIVSGECTVGWGSLRYTPCQGLATGERPPALPRTAHRCGSRPAAGCGPRYQACLALCPDRGRPSARYARWPSSISAQKLFKN